MITIKKNDQGQVVTAYEGNPEFGYAVLTSQEQDFRNGWLQIKQRSTLIRGEVQALTNAFATVNTLPGRIAVAEYTDDAIPGHIQATFNKEQSFEENIAPHLKTAGKDGPQLMHEGKRIVRFTSYDPSGLTTDLRVAHDNIDEVRAWNATQKNAEASL